jgi:DNA polymerase elongation subunit (family B)
MSEARNFVKEYEGIENFNVYGSTDWEALYIYNSYDQVIDFDPKVINVGYIDIETDKQVGGIDPTNPTAVITAITLRKNGKNVVFGYKDFKPLDENTVYNKCDNEAQLLYAFLRVWEDFDLDVISGWHIEFFDIPYIVNRIKMLLGDEVAERLSPWGMLEEKTIQIRGRENQSFVPVGIAILDYMHLYKKFSYKNSEDWKLNTIAHTELKEKKVDYTEYSDLFELYEKDHQKFIEYNIHDVVLVDRLEQKMGFIEQVFYLAYDAKVNYNDTLAVVRQWDVMIHNYLMDQGIVVPPKDVKHMDRPLDGGYVKEVIPGMYKWVTSFDFDSLYPHLIMLLNIGPDTYMGKWSSIGWSVDSALAGKLSLIDLPHDRKDIAVGANLTMYRKDFQSFLSKLMKTKYDDRVLFKNLMKDAKKQLKAAKTPEEIEDAEKLVAKYNNLQMARKIQLNSAYGALGNQWFRWFDLNHAEAITHTGQLAIQWVARDVNAYLNKILKSDNVDYVVASDTDSLYVTLDALVSRIFDEDADRIKVAEFVDKVCKEKINDVIRKSCESLYEYLGAAMPALKMKRESIADKGMWVAKKLYILSLVDDEGTIYTDPYLKIMGIAAVKSSTPAIVRTAMKKTFEIMMHGGEQALQEYIQEFKTEFRKQPFEVVAFPRGVKNMNKYKDAARIYKSATPQHVRASLMYNKLIDDHKLTSDREKIYDGDKVKYGFLKRPNPSREDVIAVINELPPEFGLTSFIDYERQFTKAYLEPINDIISLIGWSTEKKATLSDWF